MENEPSELPDTDPEMVAAVAEAQQATTFPPGPDEAPPGSITPPGNDAFANATFLQAGPEIKELVDEVLAFDELSDLQGKRCAVVWKKKSKPMMPGDIPRLADAVAVLPLYLWLGEGGLPDFLVFLHWAHFDDMRDESNFVAPETLQQHVHHALLGLEVTKEGNVKAGDRPYEIRPESAKRYGEWNAGIVQVRRQLRLNFPETDEPA